MVRVFLITLVLAGCQAYPYAEIGAGYKIEATTSVVLIEGCDFVTLSPNHSTRAFQTASCGGSNPTAHFNAGLEFDWKGDRQWIDRCEFSHWSHYFDGAGDSRRETHKDEVVCYVRWGGRPRE